MTRFFTSDNHFSHKNIIKYENRPFHTVHEMNKVMTEKWNELVQPGDLVYHLGDFALAGKTKTQELRDKLNGEIILIKGNHDRTVTSMLSCGFKEVHKTLRINIDGKEILLVHDPHPIMALSPWYQFMIHGHSHSHQPDYPRSLNICVENWNYYPLSEEEIEEIINA